MTSSTAQPVGRSDAVRDQSPKRATSPPADACRATRPGAPIIAAVDGSDAGAAAATEAARWARELDAPLTFVFVRRGPSDVFAGSAYQRRLDEELAAARRALDSAHKAAAHEHVRAGEEILEGSPARRLVEFARTRGARVLIVGSRRRRLRPSVARAVIRAADRPVLVTE
jgi:nucleotide-binding universal stress UspA family protein